MIPLTLRLRNVGPYADLDHDFQQGVSVILGEVRDAPEGVSSNGAGKSTILVGIVTALYGPPPGVKLSDLLSNGGDASELMCELTFEHGGETYRVRRSYSARGAGKTTLDLERSTDNDGPIPMYGERHPWEPLTKASIKETQAEIDRLLGLTQETFLASSVHLQGAPSFAAQAVSRVERCQLLADALGLAEYDFLQKLARRDKRAAEARLAVLASRLADDAQALARLPEQRQQLAGLAAREARTVADLAAAERDLDIRTAEAQQAQQRASERRAAQAEADAAAEALRRLSERDEAARVAADSIQVAQDELAGLASPDDVAAAEERYSEARAAYDTAMLERATLSAKIADAEQRWRDLTAEQQQLAIKVGQTDARSQKLQAALDNPSGEVCALCQRPHTDESVHREIEACWADLSSLDDRNRELVAAVGETGARVFQLRAEIADAGTVAAPSDHEVRRAREQLDRRARLEEHVNAWQRTLTEAASPEHMDAKAQALYQAETARQRLAALPPLDTPALDRVKAAEVNARGLVNLTRQQLDTLRQEKARLEADVDRLTVLERKHADDQEEAATLQTALDELTLLDRAYGRDGIPRLILESVAIPYLEAEASRLLERLGLPWQVELRTEAALKSGDGTKAVLDVVVVKDGAVEQPYQLFSGGEETRIGLALRLALARLLAHRKGAVSGLLALDEPQHLDRAGMEALIVVLYELGDEFPVILLVSHISELRDSVEQTIQVVREGSRSRVLVDDRAPDALPAEVAA